MTVPGKFAQLFASGVVVYAPPAEGLSELPCQTQFWELTTFTRYAGGFCLHLIRRNESLPLASG